MQLDKIGSTTVYRAGVMGLRSLLKSLLKPSSNPLVMQAGGQDHCLLRGVKLIDNLRDSSPAVLEREHTSFI